MTALQMNAAAINQTYNDGSITRTINAIDFINQFIINHAEKSYITRDYYGYSGTIPVMGLVYPTGYTDAEKKAFNDFIFIWKTFWNEERKKNYFEAIDALHADYNPISNYDKSSDIITGESLTPYEEDVTRTGGYSDTREIAGKETIETSESGTKTNERTFDNSDDTTNESSTDESTVFRNDTKSSTDHSGTITDEESFTNRKTTVEKSYSNGYTDTTTKEFNEDNTTTRHQYDAVTKVVNNDTISGVTKYDHVFEHTTGNIGVTTSQQMIQSEIDLRVYNIIDNYVDIFAKMYLFYI